MLIYTLDSFLFVSTSFLKDKFIVFEKINFESVFVSTTKKNILVLLNIITGHHFSLDKEYSDAILLGYNWGIKDPFDCLLLYGNFSLVDHLSILKDIPLSFFSICIEKYIQRQFIL